jgi:hypothetical protein
VSGQTVSPSAVVVGVALAATTGALVAVGHRVGSVTLLFGSIAGVIVRHGATITGAGAVITGLVLHVVAIFMWSAFCIVLARGTQRPYFAAGLVALCQFTLSWIVAALTGNGLASVLALGDRIVYAVVLAGALMIGMRFAFSRHSAAIITGTTY